jgi:hypothetical protein
MYEAEEWKLGLDASATVHLQNILSEAKLFHSNLYHWHDSLLQDYKDRMLMIAGVGQETLFRLEFDKAFWGLWERTNKVTERLACDLNRDGDGRVPLASGLLEDVHTRFVRGEHGGLTNIPAVASDVLAWLTESPLRLATTCKEALGGHLSSADERSTAPLLDGSDGPGRYRTLPEYDNPTEEFRAKIVAELDAGRLPQVNFAKIL